MAKQLAFNKYKGTNPRNKSCITNIWLSETTPKFSFKSTTAKSNHVAL